MHAEKLYTLQRLHPWNHAVLERGTEIESEACARRGRAGLSKGGIAGIVIGVICGLGVAAAGLALLLLHRRRRGQQGWQKESLDGPPIVPGRARAPGIELAHSKSDAPA